MNFHFGTIVKRRLGGLLCLAWHLGIVAQNQQVIHFNGTKVLSPNARLVLTSMDEFAFGRPVFEHCRPHSTKHALSIVGEATRLLNQPLNGWNDCYSLLTRNCESFCIHCYELSYEAGVPEEILLKPCHTGAFDCVYSSCSDKHCY